MGTTTRPWINGDAGFFVGRKKSDPHRRLLCFSELDIGRAHSITRRKISGSTVVGRVTTADTRGRISRRAGDGSFARSPPDRRKWLGARPFVGYLRVLPRYDSEECVPHSDPVSLSTKIERDSRKPAYRPVPPDQQGSAEHLVGSSLGLRGCGRIGPAGAGVAIRLTELS